MWGTQVGSPDEIDEVERNLIKKGLSAYPKTPRLKKCRPNSSDEDHDGPKS